MRMRLPTPQHVATLACGMLLLLPIAVSVAPRPAHALFGDTALAVKEYVLDTVVWQIKRAAVAALTKSTLNWINSGFKGSPAFVTNLRENLLIVGDTVAEKFFAELSNEIIDSPYQDEIALAVRTGYYLSTGGTFYIQNPFTLNQYSNDPRAFLDGDFSQGGFSAWFSTAMNCQNSPYCAYQLAVGELNSRINSGAARELKLFDWANGFKTLRGNCDETPTYSKAQNVELKTLGGTGQVGADGSIDIQTNTQVAQLSQMEPCLDGGIRTPGAILAPRLNDALGAGERQLITADEINEIVGALFAQVVNQAFGNNGLISVSAPAYGGGRPYIDTATDPSQTQSGSVGGGNTVGGVSQDDIITYLTNWQKIGSAAETALTYCPTSSLAQQTRTSATNATVRATNALAAMDAASRASIVNMITTAEVEQSQMEVRENTDSSLYGQLQNIVSKKKCP